MEYYGNALCVSYEDLVGGGIMSEIGRASCRERV